MQMGQSDPLVWKGLTEKGAVQQNHSLIPLGTTVAIYQV